MYVLDDEEKTQTETPLESEQPEKIEETKEEKKEPFLRVRVRGKDPLTGKKYDEILEVADEEEAKDRIRKGCRFEAEMGAWKADVLKMAKELAEPIANQRAMEIIAQTKREVPGVKAPTLEELQNNPELLTKYGVEIEKRAEQIAEQKVQKMLDDKASEDAELAQYHTEIGRACEELGYKDDKNFRKLLVKIIKADEVSLENIFDKARELADDLKPSLDKVPEEQRKAIVEEHIAKTKAPTKEVPEGKTKTTTRPIPKTFDELYEKEAEEHGWKP